MLARKKKLFPTPPHQQRRRMQTKFEVGQRVNTLPEPGYTGRVVLAEVNTRSYLLDCSPGALSDYLWYKVPEGLLSYPGGILAGNWFFECELSEVTE